MAFKKKLWQKIKHHKIYTRQQLAKALDVNISTISNWVNKHGLKPLNEGEKKYLFEGLDVIEFLKDWENRRKVPLEDNEFYCFTCKRAIRAAAKSITIEYTGKFGKSGAEKIIIHGVCKDSEKGIAKITSTKYLKSIMIKIENGWSV